MKKKNWIIAALIFTMMLSPSRVLAAEKKDLEVLTVEQAVNMAVANSNILKELNESKILNEESSKDTRDNLRQATTETQFLNAAVQVMQNDISSAYNNNNVTVQREQIKQSIIEFFSSIQNAIIDLEQYDREIEFAEKDLGVSRVKNQLGMVSASQLASEKSSLAKMQNERTSKETAIDKAFISLNEVLGRDRSLRYQIQLNYHYSVLDGTPLQAYISNAISHSPEIKKLESELTVEEYKINTTYTDGSSRESREIGYNQKARSLQDKKDAISSSITATYNDVMSYEIQYESEKLELAEMKKQLEIHQTKVELGKMTELELEKYQFQLEKKEESIRRIATNHEIKKAKLKNVYLN